MPAWLQVVARVNLLSYEVDALRALMIQGSISVFGLATDLVVLLLATTVLVVIGGRLYPTVAY